MDQSFIELVVVSFFLIRHKLNKLRHHHCEHRSGPRDQKRSSLSPTLSLSVVDYDDFALGDASDGQTDHGPLSSSSVLQLWRLKV